MPVISQAQTAATCAGARHAEEAVEHALHELEWNAGTTVDDFHHQLAAFLRQPHVHHTALRRVAQGVFDQVVNNAAQVRCRTAQRCAGDGGGQQAQVDAPLVGQHDQAIDALAQHGRHVHFRGRCIARDGLLPRQAQQLVHQPLCALDALLQLAETLLRLAAAHVATQRLELQADRCNGGTQFVCGVLHKTALRGEGIAQSGQQAVE